MNNSLQSRIEEIINEPVLRFGRDSGVIKTISGKEYFFKGGYPSPTYQCEANGLKELLKANAIRVAEVIAANEDFIITEYIHSGRPSDDIYEIFGRELAQLHRFKSNTFGFYEDNFIGANPQLNIPSDSEKSNWVEFYFNKRLLYQYKLAEQNGRVSASLRSGFSKLGSVVEDILNESTEEPTLIHGDLWSGNYICNEHGEVVLIDPAVYYGHREADLAMTKVFGGFPPAFYDAYIQEYPLKEGWEYRENLYKLYHVLNHLNLFGRSYLSEAEYLINSYISR